MIAKAVHLKLSEDALLTARLSTYKGQPAIFTTDPAPEGAAFPYIVAATIPAQTPRDTKTSLGREARIDVRIYAAANGSTITVDVLAERVYSLLHRQPLLIEDFVWVLSDCTGPISADESRAYGRIVTLRTIMENL